MGQQTPLVHLRRFLSFVICLSLLLASLAAEAGTASKRGRVIDFDDEVVEGMNKRPLDSLSSLADGSKKRRKPHLYRKRVGFRSETQETLRAVRYTP